MSVQKAKFSIGDIVKHKHFEFRGVIYDVDFEFNNSEEWYQSIPKNVRPRKDQPFYHLLAENDEITYEAYVSEQNLLVDDSGEPIKSRSLLQVSTLSPTPSPSRRAFFMAVEAEVLCIRPQIFPSSSFLTASCVT